MNFLSLKQTKAAVYKLCGGLIRFAFHWVSKNKRSGDYDARQTSDDIGSICNTFGFHLKLGSYIQQGVARSSSCEDFTKV